MPTVTRHNDRHVREYISDGERQGYHTRYLTRVRQTWYQLEHRTPAPILFGVFSRGRLKVVRNLTGAVNFACFHSFYPNIFGRQLIDKLFAYLLSDWGQEVLKTNKRSYGDGLDKFEPGDLNECLCPNQAQLDLLDGDEAKKIVDVAKADERMAIQMSNELIESIFTVRRSLRELRGAASNEAGGVGEAPELGGELADAMAGAQRGTQA